MKLVLITATLIVMAGFTMARARDKFIGGMSVEEIEKMAKEMDMDEYHEQMEHLVELTRYSSCLQKAVECFAKTPGKNQKKCQKLKKECEKFNIVITEEKGKKPKKPAEDETQPMKTPEAEQEKKPKETPEEDEERESKEASREEEERQPKKTTKAKQEKKQQKSPGFRGNH